jgi:TonB-linked SusC/RagA family outer membrane protein
VNLTGKVKDQEGMVLPGVAVTVKGTNIGVITNADGVFDIEAIQDEGTLVFNFIGMETKEVTYTGSALLDVVLTSTWFDLDEVVVVGYGTQTMKNVTGSIANIPVDDIKELPVSNLSEALRGQIPGLSVSGGSKRPGESATLTVRQTFSFSKDGGSDIPLIVIDGIIQVDPESGLPSLDAFNRLDPSEIESITVLKDGSAAIYGARASQGAVIVQTKRGKAGKIKFNFTSQLSFNDAVSHSKTMSAYDFGVWHNRFLKADNRDNDGQNLFSEDELEEMKTLNYDWLDKAWSGATQQKHSFNISGGSEKVTYFAGVTNYSQGANLGSQDYDKWNFRTGLEVKIAKNLNFSGSVSANSGNVEKSFTKSVANISDSSYGAKAKSSGEQADYGYLLHMPKYIPWETTVDGEDYWVSPFPRTDRNLGSANTNRAIAGWNYFASLNNGSKQTTEDFSYNANFTLNYDVPFVEGLSLKGTFSRSENTSNTEQIQLPYTLARITNYNNEDRHLASAAEDDNWKIEENQSNARVYYTKVTSRSTQMNFFLNYNRTFGSHEIGAMASVERAESNYSNNRLAYENTSSDYMGTSQTAGDLSDNTYALKGESGLLSYLGRVTYSFRSKYLFQFLFRSDASTKFAPENYWGFFPNAQIGWVMSEEPWFYDALPWVNFLKLRYSVGKTGKDNIKAWRWEQYYTIYTDKGLQFGNDGGELGGALSPNVSPNREAGWDTTIKHNAGTDINILI